MGLGLGFSRVASARTRPKNPLFLNTVLLGGPPQEKLQAAAAAGFDQVELWRQDVETFPGGAEAVRADLQRLPLGLTDYQVLLDFDGAPGDKRAAKRAEAVAMLDTAVQVGARTLLAPASTDPACDPTRVTEDLRWLADEAAKRGLRVAYEGMAWSTLNHTLPDAHRAIALAGAPNLGLVVDAFHIFVRGRTAADLDGVPPERIYLVQLSDCDHAVAPEAYRDTARHDRLLPGQGRFPLATLTRKLQAMNYGGAIGLEVFNDQLKAQPPEQVARQAFAALTATWVA